MNIKAPYKYQMAENKSSLIIFYIVIVAIYVANFILAAVFSNINPNSFSSTSTGIEMASVIFIFIVGLCVFRENFLFSMQNGVSRRSFFLGRLLTSVTLAGIMTVIDTALLAISRVLPIAQGQLNFGSLFEFSYGWTGPYVHIIPILYSFFMYLAAVMFGYFITVMFYRLPKLGKVLVGAGVPIVLFIVLPIIDTMMFGGVITSGFAWFITTVFGLTTGQPLLGVLSFFVLAVILSALGWLLVRRAPVKT